MWGATSFSSLDINIAVIGEILPLQGVQDRLLANRHPALYTQNASPFQASNYSACDKMQPQHRHNIVQKRAT